MNGFRSCAGPDHPRIPSYSPHRRMTRSDAWTRAHDLALVYISLAFGTDHDLVDNEVSTIQEKLGHWREHFDAADILEVIMEAVTVFLEGDAAHEVTESVNALRSSLDPAQKRRALEDVIRIAEADGILLTSEKSLITQVARAWNLKELSQELLAGSEAEHEDLPEWTLLHDLGLIYLALAHSTDDDLSTPEIDAIIERLQDWKSGLNETDARNVVRTALRFYAEGPDETALQRSVLAVKTHLPIIQRLAALDDIVYVAEADGHLNDHEKTLIGSLADAWGLGVRLNGRHPGP